VVATAKCNACHNSLGIFTDAVFHAGERNDANSCSFCHNTNQTNGGWSGNVSTFIHGIHGGSKRTTPFTWHAASATENYTTGVTYPGKLNKCEQCHLPDTYNFSATNSAKAVPNLLWTTNAKGTMASTSTSAYSFSPDITLDVNYGTAFSYNGVTGVATQAAATTLVSSPISAACYSCHDDKTARTHMELNGGILYKDRSNVGKVETCLICHGKGTIADIKVVHN
jgi:OmcA/MtrC family decaheme c-type cytochrome